MSASNDTQHHRPDPFPWTTVQEAEATFASLPDGDYRVPDLYTRSPELAAAALYILNGRWAEPFAPHPGSFGSSSSPAGGPSQRVTIVRREAAEWVFRVRAGELVELARPGHQADVHH